MENSSFACISNSFSFLCVFFSLPLNLRFFPIFFVVVVFYFSANIHVVRFSYNCLCFFNCWFMFLHFYIYLLFMLREITLLFFFPLFIFFSFLWMEQIENVASVAQSILYYCIPSILMSYEFKKEQKKLISDSAHFVYFILGRFTMKNNCVSRWRYNQKEITKILAHFSLLQRQI